MFVYLCSAITDGLLDYGPRKPGVSLLYSELNSINKWMNLNSSIVSIFICCRYKSITILCSILVAEMNAEFRNVEPKPTTVDDRDAPVIRVKKKSVR
jgi:hypothetical protein